MITISPKGPGLATNSHCYQADCFKHIKTLQTNETHFEQRNRQNMFTHFQNTSKRSETETFSTKTDQINNILNHVWLSLKKQGVPINPHKFIEVPYFPIETITRISPIGSSLCAVAAAPWAACWVPSRRIP